MTPLLDDEPVLPRWQQITIPIIGYGIGIGALMGEMALYDLFAPEITAWVAEITTRVTAVGQWVTTVGQCGHIL